MDEEQKLYNFERKGSDLKRKWQLSEVASGRNHQNQQITKNTKIRQTKDCSGKKYAAVGERKLKRKVDEILSLSDKHTYSFYHELTGLWT